MINEENNDYQSDFEKDEDCYQISLMQDKSKERSITTQRFASTNLNERLKVRTSHSSKNALQTHKQRQIIDLFRNGKDYHGNFKDKQNNNRTIATNHMISKQLNSTFYQTFHIRSQQESKDQSLLSSNKKKSLHNITISEMDKIKNNYQKLKEEFEPGVGLYNIQNEFDKYKSQSIKRFGPLVVKQQKHLLQLWDISKQYVDQIKKSKCGLTIGPGYYTNQSRTISEMSKSKGFSFFKEQKSQQQDKQLILNLLAQNPQKINKRARSTLNQYNQPQYPQNEDSIRSSTKDVYSFSKESRNLNIRDVSIIHNQNYFYQQQVSEINFLKKFKGYPQ